MIESMTGFGRGNGTKAPWEVFVEVSAVNSRFLDLNLHLPRELYFYQQEIRDLVKGAVRRGKLNVYIAVKRQETGGLGTVRPEQIAQLLEEADRLARRFQLPNDLALSHLPHFTNLLTDTQRNREQPELWQLVQRVLGQALRRFHRMRREEGRELLADLRGRLRTLETHLGKVNTQFHRNRGTVRDTIQKRVAKLAGLQQMTPERLDMEVALLADKLDINEEVTRLRSHIKLFRATLPSREPIGKKLNFILQEMNREANTIASKSASAPIAQEVVAMKEELECLREQVQNLE